MFKRSSGILLHVSSLPGDYGIGSFGKEAMEFVDLLAGAGSKYWQVLPFSPPDEHNSPYASISTFAGNINFIDLDKLRDSGLLTDAELKDQRVENPYAAAYDFLNSHRLTILYKAFTRLDDQIKQDVAHYREENADWLEDYALFSIFKEANMGKPWYEWKEEHKFRDVDTIRLAKKDYKDTIDFICFCQYLFHSQWREIRDYANKKGVEIIGDLPIYVAMDSVDVWSNRKLFDINEEGQANNVAGVPPDYFSSEGQKWGQALYRWKVMERDNYQWWMTRLEKNFEMFDVIRIDHFRAFSAFWEVPQDAETAKEGKWIKGPGMRFFRELFKSFEGGQGKIIAEDLGEIDDEVRELLQESGLPGMRVLQFGFMDSSDNMHLPHNHPQNSVVYTGTHDNTTMLGWLWEASPQQREMALDYCSYSEVDWAQGGAKSQSLRAIINALWRSPGNVAIVPIQDLCGFGSDTKMNAPGVADGNWRFRVSREQLAEIDFDWLKKQNYIYHRHI